VSERAAAVGLSFRRRGGPLLAVAGVCGGAGATTLAYLIAASAAPASPEPVLLADLGGPAAAISLYTRVESPQSFPVLAYYVANGRRPPGALFATGEGGLRVLASHPDLDPPVPEAAARRILEQARAAHGLAVVDAGTLVRPVERIALGLATHIAWVVPASPLGVRRAAVILEALPPVGAHELIVARSEQGAPRSVIADLADIADLRGTALLLLPQLCDLLGADLAEVTGRVAVSLQAIGSFLRR
jgi:Flp pilus assembly CpaE family ATPase